MSDYLREIQRLVDEKVPEDTYLDYKGKDSLNNTPTNITINNFADGTYQWNITCWDDSINSNTSETRSFTVDATGPKTLLNSPSNNTNQSSGEVTFNYTPIFFACKFFIV